MIFVYEKNNAVCITFKDNKPVESPEYILEIIDQELIVNGQKVTPVTFRKLSADIVNQTAEVITTPTIINLNNHIISIPEDTAGDGVFRVKDGGELTIDGNGTIDGVGKNAYNMAIWADGGKVIINNGTITNKGAVSDNDGDHFDLVYAKGNGIVEINGGTFIAETPKWTLNKRDNDPCEIVVKGGTFYKYNPAETETEPGGVTSFVADGYKVIEDGDWYTVVKA